MRIGRIWRLHMIIWKLSSYVKKWTWLPARVVLIHVKFDIVYCCLIPLVDERFDLWKSAFYLWAPRRACEQECAKVVWHRLLFVGHANTCVNEYFSIKKLKKCVSNTTVLCFNGFIPLALIACTVLSICYCDSHTFYIHMWKYKRWMHFLYAFLMQREIQAMWKQTRSHSPSFSINTRTALHALVTWFGQQ